MHHAPRAQVKSGVAKSRGMGIVAAIGALLVVSVITFFVLSSSSVSSKIDNSKYQAIFLTNGQVYFGKLSGMNGGYLRLTDIYYLQSSDGEGDSLQDSNSDSSSDVQLVKLGEELHGPEDEMVINKDEMLFFENLKSDGKVSKAIEQFSSEQ